MKDSYVECLVKQKSKKSVKVLRSFLVALTVMFVLGFISFAGWSAFIPAVLCGVGAYFAGKYANLEYEYLYLDRELSFDMIMNQTSRKRVGTYSIDEIEIIAPIKSYHLDDFRSRNVTEKDYSVGEELQPDLRYVLYTTKGEKIVFNPSEELVGVIKDICPRKVFSE